MHYIVFNSVTGATRVKNYFRFSGERVSMTHTPKEISKGGCSYSIVAEPRLTDQVLEAAKEYGIKVLGIYEQTPNGFSQINRTL